MYPHTARWTRMWHVQFVRCLEAFKTCCQSKPYADLDYACIRDVPIFFRHQQLLELLPAVLPAPNMLMCEFLLILIAAS